MKQFLRKHLPDQPFSRSTKRELCDELQDAEKKVESMKVAVSAVCKRLSASGSSGGIQGSGPDPVVKEKRVKKLLEHQLGTSMLEAIAQMKDDQSPFRHIMDICGNTEINLAKEITDHEYQVEQMVCKQLYPIVEQDLPNIIKAKKQLTKLLNEKDSAISKFNTQSRQGEPLKIAQAQEEVEEAESKAEQSVDALASEMFSLIVKESELAGAILQYMKLQRAYHESALHTLTSIVPQLEEHINEHTHKRVFGISLEEHLRVTKREIAFPIELCVCALLELGLKEEGLFRMAASTSRLKRMKLSVDAGLLHENTQLPQEYRDVHVIGGVLKSYLRELPEPLISPHLHERFLMAISSNNNEESRVNDLYNAIQQLPAPNYNNLCYLVKFLSILSQHHMENKMTPSNIAIVMAPNILRSAESNSLGYDMGRTASINCVTELLVKHADRFFKEDVNFFVTISKENFLYEDGFHPQYGKGAINGGMSKSLHEYSSSKDLPSDGKTTTNLVQSKQSHSRSNSHDTSLILMEGEMKRTQSNGSLSDVSSQVQGSPKPNSRTKKNKLAPSPPTFVSPDKSNNLSKTVPHATDSTLISTNNVHDSTQAKDSLRDVKSNHDVDRPDKPPRPEFNKEVSNKIVSGSQTINRSSYKSKIGSLSAKIGQKLSSSRENLAEFASAIKDRRKSLEFEHDSVGSVSKTKEPVHVSIAATQHNTGKTTVSEGCQTASSISPRSSINHKSTHAPPKPTTDIVSKPILDIVVKPVIEPPLKPNLEALVKPSVEPLAKPIVEPLAKPIVETLAKPVVEPLAKPILEPLAKPLAVVESLTKLGVEPIVKSGVEHFVKPEPIQKPVAAPRNFILKQETNAFLEKESNLEVQLRHKPNLEASQSTSGKPAIPERPATLRPQSFRNSGNKNSSLENILASIDSQSNGNSASTQLERTHVYTVDKQHPTIIQVSNNGQAAEKATAVSPTESVSSTTISGGAKGEPPSETILATSQIQIRKSSQSEGSVLDVPPSPRPYHKPPRPQIPAPPPPTMAPSKVTTGEPNDSTDL